MTPTTQPGEEHGPAAGMDANAREALRPFAHLMDALDLIRAGKPGEKEPEDGRVYTVTWGIKGSGKDAAVTFGDLRRARAVHNVLALGAEAAPPSPAPASAVGVALREAEIGLAAMIRLSEMGYEESLREPEESGNFASYERAKRCLLAVRSYLSTPAPRVEDAPATPVAEAREGEVVGYIHEVRGWHTDGAGRRIWGDWRWGWSERRSPPGGEHIRNAFAVVLLSTLLAERIKTAAAYAEVDHWRLKFEAERTAREAAERRLAEAEGVLRQAETWANEAWATLCADNPHPSSRDEAVGSVVIRAVCELPELRRAALRRTGTVADGEVGS